MLKPNTENSNNSATLLGELASNTRLILGNTTPATNNKPTQATDTKSLEDTNSNNQNNSVLHNHIDWITLNFEGLIEEQFQGLLSLLGKELIVIEKDKPFSQGKKAKSYRDSISSPLGLRGGYNCYQKQDSSVNHYDVSISLTGEYFAPLSATKQWELCRTLYFDYSARCSRIDTSIDDYSFKLIPVNDMVEAFRRGDNFDFRSYSHRTDESDPNNPSTVHYLGAEGSPKLIRVYSHKNECLRLETQFRKGRTQVVYETISNLKREDESDDEWDKVVQKTIGEIAIGAIDFRNKSKKPNKKKTSRRDTDRLPFWQEFIDLIGVPHLIKIPANKLDMTSHIASFNWLERNASKTIAKAFHILGKDRFISYIFRLVKLGESNFTPQDEKQIKHLKVNLDYLNFD